MTRKYHRTLRRQTVSSLTLQEWLLTPQLCLSSAESSFSNGRSTKSALALQSSHNSHHKLCQQFSLQLNTWLHVSHPQTPGTDREGKGIALRWWFLQYKTMFSEKSNLTVLKSEHTSGTHKGNSFLSLETKELVVLSGKFYPYKQHTFLKLLCCPMPVKHKTHSKYWINTVFTPKAFGS